MYKKTVLKRLCKHIEIDFDNADQLRVYDEETAVENDPKVIAEQEVEAVAAEVEEFDDVDVVQNDEGMPFA